MESFKGNLLKTSKIYDNLGNVIQSVSTTGIETRYAFDALGRLEGSDVQGIGITQYTYDYAGGNTILKVTTPANHKYESITDATGKVITKIDSGGKLEYEYDGQGNQTKVYLNGNLTLHAEFDGVGNRVSLFEPNMGTTTYGYDGFQQLIYQKDSKGNETINTYDIIGRIESRKGKEGLTTYEYKKTRGGINKIETVKGFNSIDQSMSYDAFGRLLTLTDNGFTHTYEYDKFDNEIAEIYPTGYRIDRAFDKNSFLEKVFNKGTKKTTEFFTAQQMDNQGNYSEYDLGNGLHSSISFNDNGFPTHFSTKGALDLEFDFNMTTGNLTSRTTGRKGLKEFFEYDVLDRLTGAKVGGNVININYADNGNIIHKSDAGIGEYSYDQTKVNAVLGIEQATDFGDQNQKMQYTPFHQIDEIFETTDETDWGLNFIYGADYERRVMELRSRTRGIYDDAGNLIGGHGQYVYERRFYSGNYEEDHVAPLYKGQLSKYGEQRQIHYIEAGDGLCAIMIRTIPEEGEAVDSIFYVHKDYLGSLLTFTNEQGAVAYEQNFDAWGRYRNIEDLSYVGLPGLPRWLYRGYTGHEHLLRQDIDAGAHTFYLINMNGRLYDPVNGRMLSVDNYANDNAGTQGYNRYTYANNNPLRYTDPDGEWVLQAAGIILGGAVNIYAHWGEITAGGSINWGKLGYAGAVGAGAGLAASFIGPAALTGLGVTAGTTTAAAIGYGALSGAVGAAISSPLQYLGNKIVFPKDEYSLKQFGKDVLIGGAAGAAFAGLYQIPGVRETIDAIDDKLSTGITKWWNSTFGNTTRSTITTENMPRGVIELGELSPPSELVNGHIPNFTPEGLSQRISVQKQLRHLLGTAPSNKGYLNNMDDAKSVLSAVHSGQATYLGNSSHGYPVYRFNGVTGTNVNVGAGFPNQPTNIFIIKGTIYPTVVPTNPFFRP
jgi:RHS repeat-associated protein